MFSPKQALHHRRCDAAGLNHQGRQRRVRHMLVESAWTYHHAPKIGPGKLYKLEKVSPAVREIA
jgi:hypothetical protein